MVNRVDNSNIYTNSYTQATGQRKKVDAASVPAFLLDHDERGVVWDREPEEKRNEGGLALNNKLSGEKKDTYESTISKPEEKEKTESPYTDALFENISRVIKNLFKKILDFVWYGNDEKKAEGSEESTDAAGLNSEASSHDVPAEDEKVSVEKESAEIKKTGTNRINKGSSFEIPELEGTPARNTSIITYYDRRGRIVKQDDLDTRRILFNEPLDREIDAGEYGKYRKYM